MSPLGRAGCFLLSLLCLCLGVRSQSSCQPCVTVKGDGGDPLVGDYSFLESDPTCEFGCSYTKDGNPADKIYCFKDGIYETEICGGSDPTSGSTAPGSTAAGATAGGSPAAGSTAAGSTAAEATAGGSTAAESTAAGSTAGGSSSAGSTVAGSTAAASDTTAATTDEVVTRVQGYIDAGTCGTISASTSCGTSATSYYKEITYGGKRVIITNQVPDHVHEQDAVTANPNTACERYQYISLPIDPAKGSSSTRTELGTVGTAVTGGAFFNDWSSPTGTVAMVAEGASLDSCFGHSAPGGSYHYHANINCTSAGAATGSTDPDICKLIGYYIDGVPVYGLCKDTAGQQFSSCYTCTGTCTASVTTVSGTYTGLGEDDGDYTYSESAFTAGTCNLDLAQGAIHPTTGKYSYFMTTEYPWVPIYYFGDQGQASYCSAA